ncbi:MAG: SO2930 family diheme c-type cytochrome, partial [Woeseiaceae bacterium]
GISDGVLPYDLNTPLFSDYALKLRTVWMPKGTMAEYRGGNVPFDFPVGTILSKTFHYEKAPGIGARNYRVLRVDRESHLDKSGQLSLDEIVLVETRLLIRYDDGWKALPYVWNDQQNEAYLQLAGDLKRIELVADNRVDSIVYVVPDANQCASCHTTNHASKQLQPIGPRAWLLNRDYAYAGHTANQLDYWQSAGLLADVPRQPPKGVRWSARAGASLSEVAKSYLDINCAHCHNSAGAADTSGLDLAIDTPLGREYGICKPPVAVGRGSGDRPYDIYPGRPEDSILIYRMQHTDPAIAMPELGRGTVHEEAVSLLSAWVESLAGDC